MAPVGSVWFTINITCVFSVLYFMYSVLQYVNMHLRIHGWGKPLREGHWKVMDEKIASHPPFHHPWSRIANSSCNYSCSLFVFPPTWEHVIKPRMFCLDLQDSVVTQTLMPIPGDSRPILEAWRSGFWQPDFDRVNEKYYSYSNKISKILLHTFAHYL